MPGVYVCNPLSVDVYVYICRLCSCINYYVEYVKSIFIFSGCSVVYAKCVVVYVASVSISAKVECVCIVRICVYAGV